MIKDGLSKSKIAYGHQCPKRLWLSTYKPEVAEIDAAAQARFVAGNEVGEAARGLFQDGVLVEHDDNLKAALAETEKRLSGTNSVTLFEGTVQAGGVLVRCDVLERKRGKLRLIEVKASTEVKDHYALDVAIQAWVLKQAGYSLDRIELAHINNEFIYKGDGDYTGLFSYVDMREAVQEWLPKLPGLIKRMQSVLRGQEPKIAIGPHCTDPYPCPFMEYCWPKAEYPVTLLPGRKDLAFQLLSEGYKDLRKVPASRITSEQQRWVHRVTCRGKPELKPEARVAFKGLGYPRYYLDFETVAFAVPIWKGTRPYEALPFQWSCHIESKTGALEHKEFLHTDASPPMRAFAESLLEGTDKRGPIFVYSHYEKRILNGLIDRFPALERSLLAIIDRLVDLYPITKRHYYHPDMLGHWSIKNVLPTIAPQLDYANLDEIQDGTAAMAVFREMISGTTDAKRRAEIRNRLLEYCKRDTQATYEVAQLLQSAVTK